MYNVNFVSDDIVSAMEEMENGLKKPQDFKYTVEFDQGGSGTRKYIIAKCKKC